VKQKNITIILDRSGSMGSVQAETVKGFNKFVREQDSDALVSLHQFDAPNGQAVIDATFQGQRAKGLKLRSDQYAPRGWTPLLDAVGKVVSDIKAKGDHVVVIITDGLENASTEWTQDRVRKLIEQKREKGWQFVFMGAAIDAYGEAAGIGVPKMNTYAYAATGRSTGAAWTNVSSGTSDYLRGVTNTVLMPDNDTADSTYTPPKS